MKKSQLNIEIYHLIKKLLGNKIAMKLHFSLKKKKLLETKIIFIHVPKAAGTSISEVLYGQRIGHYSLDEYIAYLGLEQVKKCYVFTVVRDPVERLYSAWKYAVKGGTKDGGVHNLMFFKRPEFQDFNNFVQQWLVHQNLNDIDVLFKPQTFFIKSNKYNLPKDAIFYLDAIKTLEKKLGTLKNAPIKLPHKNIVTSPGNRGVVSNISAKTVEVIKEIYKNDYLELFDLNDEV